jgi:hypothetical protein
MGIYSVFTEQKRWVAIVKADSDMEAVIVAILAMDGYNDTPDAIHVRPQHSNNDAARRLGDRDLIAWKLGL